ncbi:MAG: alcohol dehydrogenase catalytic domain-containing protein [Actinobacteria bacterium]|nr:alcohol dehydrogenase catalytic domain-containing protein [Actinomycetota bacterium]
MKALVVAAPGDISLLDLDAPTKRPAEVIVKPVLVGLCGTDLEIIDGSIDQAYVRMPLTIGHEWAGIVVDSAPGAPVVGTRVVVEGIIACGDCPECLNGDTNRCLTYDELGFTRPGAAAELIAVPAALVHSLDDAVSFESGVLVEPAAVVYRAIDRARPVAGTRVLIVGDGTVGLLAATLVRNWSPASVHVLGARAAQRPLAMAAGADAFLTDPTALEGTYGLVIEAAGVVAAAETALASVARGGTVVLVGLAGTGAVAGLPIDDIVNGDVSVVGSFSYTSRAWQSVVDLLNAGRVSFDFLVTHRFALGDWESAISTLRHSDGVRGKVLLRVGDPQDG